MKETFLKEILRARVIIEAKHHHSVGKESFCNAGDPGLIPRLGRSPRRRFLEWLPLWLSW